VSSSIKQAHIPLLRGGAPMGLSEVVGSEVERRGGDGGDGGGSGGVKRMNQASIIDVQFKLRSHSH